MVNNDDTGWKTQAFRQSVINKIEEAIQRSGMPSNKSSIDMENQVFTKANTKDEYLGFVARLILHVREMNNAKKLNASAASTDPMNALRAMTQPGSGAMMSMPQQGGPEINTASNLLQSLNQRPNMQKMAGIQPGVMSQMGGGQMGSMPQSAMHGGPMGNQMNVIAANQMNNVANAGGPIVNANSISNQMAMGGQIGNTMSGAGPMSNQMGGVMNNSMIGGQIASPMSAGMAHSQMNLQMNHMAAAGQRKMVPDGMMIPGQGNIAYIPSRCTVPNQFTRQNTPPSNPSPMQITPGSNMIPSPALVPSHSPTQLPSGGPMVGPVMRPSGPNMAPSPNSNISLNTPGGPPQTIPSPLSNDEQAYREKVKKLSRYIEPLRRWIAQLGSADHEKVGKMKKLLEILTSPGQRITMETLLKCEVVLEKLDIKVVADPLIDAISAALQNPNANHIFQRTFEPVMATLNGKPLKNLPRPLKRKHVEETVSDIPEVLQGEVARLDQRFKVSLDPVQQSGSKSVHLLCWLDDRHLPCIPPVQITIPEDYPSSSPKCNLSNYEYGATKFLQLIQEALQSRMSKLPSRYTVSQLLDTWENSVRETCSSDQITNLDSSLTVS